MRTLFLISIVFLTGCAHVGRGLQNMGQSMQTKTTTCTTNQVGTAYYSTCR